MNKAFIFLSIMLLSLPGVAQIPTSITVRAKAVDAKFIGSSMGGAMIVIKDALTDSIMASGKTRGSTGDTKLIMKSIYCNR